jgi:hypothetical protein
LGLWRWDWLGSRTVMWGSIWERTGSTGAKMGSRMGCHQSGSRRDLLGSRMGWSGSRRDWLGSTWDCWDCIEVSLGSRKDWWGSRQGWSQSRRGWLGSRRDFWVNMMDF